MKILMVNKFLYPNGGSETYIFGVGRQLEQMGHQVQYFGMEHPNRVVGNRAGIYTASMDFHSGKLQKLLYPFKIIYSREAARKITQVLEDFSPDVVHLNNFNFQLTPSILYAIKRFVNKYKKSIRIVYTAHDYQWICPNHMLQIPQSGELCSRCREGAFFNCTKYNCIHGSKLRSLLGSLEAKLYQQLKTYRLVDTLICPSHFMEKMLLSNPLFQGKTVVIHNFIDSMGKADKAEGNPGEYVLYFGRYAREKGISTLLKVCASLPQIPFVFAGSGPLETEVKQLENIKDMGFQPPEQLQKLIQNARFVVFPSEWYENCPFSVMEAQSLRVPVLASDLGGTSELIQDGITGELFEGGDAEALKEKIRRLWEQPELCAAYAANCGSLPFDRLEEYCKKLMQVYTGGEIRQSNP
ncbi:MAG: glycosyltransferase [Lachnospiraceae bacterium]|nr:glycosyltransferase [Lachnospiraceae bacterium]